MAKIMPVSVSPIFTLAASHAAIGMVSRSGWMGVCFRPMETCECPRSRLSSDSPSSIPISTSDILRGLRDAPRRDRIMSLEEIGSDDGESEESIDHLYE